MREREREFIRVFLFFWNLFIFKGKQSRVIINLFSYRTISKKLEKFFYESKHTHNTKNKKKI